MRTPSLKLISALAPYAAVLIGLYILKNAWIAIALYHLGLTAFLIADNRKHLRKKICTGFNPIIAAAGAVTSALIFPIIFFLWGHMQLESTPLNSALAKFGLHGTSWLLFMIYFSTVQPFLEELYWRGYLQGNHKHFSWTDFAFAGYHILVLVWFIKLPWLIIAFIVLAAAAYTWRHIASKLDGLLVPLISHIVADISIVTATYILIQ